MQSQTNLNSASEEHKPPPSQLITTIENLKHSNLFTEPFTRKEIFTVLTIINKSFYKQTEKYRFSILNLAINKLKIAAEALGVRLIDDKSLPTNHRIKTIFNQLEFRLTSSLLAPYGVFGLFENPILNQIQSAPYISEFLNPAFLKYLFPITLKDLLLTCSDVLTDAAYHTLIDPNQPLASIAEFIKQGANLNSKNSMLTNHIFANNNSLALEELLSSPEKQISHEDLTFTRKPYLLENLDYLKILMLKGALFSDILTLLFFPNYIGNWFAEKFTSDLDFAIEFLEFAFKNLNKEGDGRSFLNLLGLSGTNYTIFIDLYSQYSPSRFKMHQITEILINIFKKLMTLNITVVDSLIALMSGLQHRLNKYNNTDFLYALMQHQTPDIDLFYLQFIAEHATSDTTIENFSVLLAYGEETYLGSYAKHLSKPKNIFLQKSFYDASPEKFTKIFMSLCLNPSQQPLSKIPNFSPDQIPHLIIMAKLQSIFRKPELLEHRSTFITCLFWMFGLNKIIPNAYLATKVSSISQSHIYLSITTNKYTIDDLVKKINSVYENAAHVEIDKESTNEPISNEYQSLPNINKSLDQNDKEINYILYLRSDLFLNPNFLNKLKTCYEKLLSSTDLTTQQYVDKEFKQATRFFKAPKAFPDIEDLTKNLNELNDDFIAKAINSEETTKLIVKIKLFIEEFLKQPRNASFASLNKEIYEDTQVSRLITKFGIIYDPRNLLEPNGRQLLEPIHEAAKSLTFRHP